MRPLYQTNEDARHERSVINSFSDQFSVCEVDSEETGEDGRRRKGEVLFEQTGTTAPYDFVMKKLAHVMLHTTGVIRVPGKEVLALIEVKKRKPDFDDYPTYKLSKAKCDTLIKLSDEKNIPAFLVVGWRDIIGWMYINAPKSSLSYKEYFQPWRRGGSGKSLKELIDSCEAFVNRWGRYDRNDPQDIELAYEWENSNFSLFDYE